MRNTNKKGFTIVELVIVVAVIAILAAVLIPTFSGIIRKANISSDTVVAKNLNTAAIAAGADTFEDALAAVKEAGYYVANLNAKAADCYFVWEDDSNQFVLYDLKNSEIIYSNTKVDGAPDASWCFAVNNATVAAKVKAVLANITIKNTAASIADVKDIVAAGGEVTIYVDESVIMDKTNVIVIDSASTKVTIDLGSAVVAGDNNTTVAIENVPFRVNKGELTIKGGNIQSTGTALDADGKEMNNVINTIGGKLTVEGAKIETVDAVLPVALSSTVATIKNTTIISGNNVIGGYDGSDIKVVNCTIEADYLAFFSSSSGGTAANIEIDGGKYHTTISNLLGVHGGVITVKDGEFNCDNATKTFKFYNVTGGKIILEGGTFNGVKFADLDEATIRSWCNLTDCANGVDVTFTNGAWVISVK